MKKETLSQLLDGELELPAMEEALDALLASPELQQTWHCMHTLRASIHSGDQPASCNIQERVSLALESEPEIIAPNNIELLPVDTQQPSKLADLAVPLESPRSNIIKYFAVAASVAALMMVFYSPGNDMISGVAKNGNEPVSPVVAEDIAHNLQSMIVQHGEFSGVAALNGLVAYAKVVTGTAVIKSSQ